MICSKCQNNIKLETKRGKDWKCFHGESSIALNVIKDESIEAIITDPPYGTGANSTAGLLKSSANKYQNSDTKHKLPAFAGDSLLPEAWSEMMHKVLNACYRVGKPGCELLFFCDWRSHSAMLREIGAVGFGIRTTVVWAKGRNSRPNRNGFRSQSELAIHARKPGKLERSEDIYLDGVFNYPTKQNNKLHVTEKPLELMKQLVQLCPKGGTVLDPFQGSATTGVATVLSARKYIGIEAVKYYHDVAVERLKSFSKKK